MKWGIDTCVRSLDHDRLIMINKKIHSNLDLSIYLSLQPSGRLITVRAWMFLIFRLLSSLRTGHNERRKKTRKNWWMRKEWDVNSSSTAGLPPTSPFMISRDELGWCWDSRLEFRSSCFIVQMEIFIVINEPTSKAVLARWSQALPSKAPPTGDWEHR